MIPLLPYEKRLAEMLGISQEVYGQWKAITVERSRCQPASGPVCGPLVPVLVNIAIAVGVSLLSSLLFPTREQSRIATKRTKGDPRTSNQRSSPRFGFDSAPEPARVGQFIPVVIAKRENGLGGVRVAMPLLWSQILARNGSMMLRGIFLAGASGMAANAWDPRGWAFGNNTLGAYAYAGSALERSSRYSIYYSPAGGRINGGHLIAGREASGDAGNFENGGGQDVFAVSVGGGQYKTAFCMAENISTSASFGLYGWCPNAMVSRQPVLIQPTILARIGGGDVVRTDDDAAALVELWKGKFHWSTRGGLIQRKPANSNTWTTPATGAFSVVNLYVNIGDQLKYKLDRGTDAITKIRINTDNSRVKTDDAEFDEKMNGVAASVAGVQNAADSALIPGDLYLVGTCWAVLQERISQDQSQNVFVSDSEQEPTGDGNSMEYVFTVVQPGNCEFVGFGFTNPPPLPTQNGNTIYPEEYDPDDDFADLTSGTENRYKVCSQAAQIFRMAIASMGAVREFSVSEIIIKSKVGLTINGMTNFKSCPTIQDINAKAGQNQVGTIADGVLSVSRYDSSGDTYTAKMRRYSAFVLQYSENRGESWIEFPEVFAVAGIDGEDVYNYLRIKFPSSKRWERRLIPVPSWRIRSTGLSQVTVLDTNSREEITRAANGVTVSTTGYTINPTDDNKRKIAQIEPTVDIGLNWTDHGLNSMIDGYARFAEGFAYESVRSSVGNAPEHEVRQVNYYGDVDATPTYEDLALVGVNISGDGQSSSVSAFSGFCNNGREMPSLLNSDAREATHLFPDWLREIMTSEELGAWPAAKAAQIDRPSFQAAAQWCQDRQYYYDAVEEQPIDVLSWAADIAQAHLLKLVRLGGVYHFKKAIEFDEPLEISGQFNNGNISEGSFRLNSIDYLARQPFAVLVKWREESTGLESPLFARERVAIVREASASANAPIKELDLSKWCTNYRQAIDAACYLIRFAAVHDHRISFTTTPDVLMAKLHSASFFRMDIDVVSYNAAVQGFIQKNGVVVTTRPDLLPASGAHPGLVWDMRSEPKEQDIAFSVDGTASPVEHFFAIANSTTRQRTYEIEKVSIDAIGVITVNAFHHPVSASGMSLLGVNWTTYQTDANWIIEL